MNKELLKYCIGQIEKKLDWAPSDLWLNQDFELLSDKIFEETGIKLSITTLKRVWGKVSYASEPSISTLNALAMFIGHEHWSDLKNGHGVVSKKQSTKSKIPTLKYMLTASLLVVFLIVVFGISGKDLLKKSKPIDLEQVSFKVQPVTLGLPNSVVFSYDFGQNNIEKATIQQSWNRSLTFDIDPTENKATGIYYYPGYFKAKLLGEGEILKEQDLHIRTDGWMGTIRQDKVPRYLYYGELEINNKLGISTDLLNEIHNTETKQVETLTYHYFDDLSAVSGDEFIFETRFRNTYQKSNGICQQVQLLVHGKNAVYLTPFSIPGCSSKLNLITAGESHSGKENDFSKFGIETSDWHNFKLMVSDQQAKYYLDDRLMLTKEASSNIGDIVGFKFRFEGAGEIDFVKLSKKEEVFFSEDFSVHGN